MILKLQSRFRLSELSTDAIVKLFRKVLTEIDGERFDEFPKSLYVTKRRLGVVGPYKKFAVCPTCHKLFAIEVAEGHKEGGVAAEFRCDHVEFPFHHTEKYRQACGTIVTK